MFDPSKHATCLQLCRHNVWCAFWQIMATDEFVDSFHKRPRELPSVQWLRFISISSFAKFYWSGCKVKWFIPITVYSTVVFYHIKTGLQLHKLVYTDRLTEWHHVYVPGVGAGNVGARRWQQSAAVWERSYLTVGADGSQLCVWPGLWLTVRPGRDGEMEDGAREERRRHCLALMSTWGVGVEKSEEEEEG